MVWTRLADGIQFLRLDRGANLLFLLIVGLLVLTSLLARRLAEQGAQVVLQRMAWVLALVAASFLVLSESLRLLWVLAMLPTAMIIHHAIALYIYRRPALHVSGRAAREGGQPAFFESAARDAVHARDTYFSVRTLTLRYGVPATLLMWLVIVIGYAAFVADDWTHGWNPLRPAVRMGFAGAYTYVVLLLSQRTFRRDITHGVAAWCAATLALGPILSSVLFLIWRGSADSAWSAATVYFFAGLAPRQVITIVQESAKRLLHSATQISAHRVIPLSEISGITLETQERLDEEGIQDAVGLAMADVFRLLRNTSFDARQLIAWIDEAILIVTLPAHWQKLEGLGFHGAIDLAHAVWQFDLAAMGGIDAKRVTDLRQLLGTDAPAVLGTARRLFEDAQVQQIWALYQGSPEDR